MIINKNLEKGNQSLFLRHNDHIYNQRDHKKTEAQKYRRSHKENTTLALQKRGDTRVSVLA